MFNGFMFLVYVGALARVAYGKMRLTRDIRKSQGNVLARHARPWRRWIEKAQVVGLIVIGSIIAGYPFPGTVSRYAVIKVAGALILLAAVEVHLRAKRDLGANWSNAMDGETVRTGPITRHGLYRYSRNPMYTSSLAMVFGLILMTQNLFVVGMWLVMFAYFWKVIRSEEYLLMKVKGQEYIEYCNEVPRFL